MPTLDVDRVLLRVESVDFVRVITSNTLKFFRLFNLTSSLVEKETQNNVSRISPRS